MEILSAEVSKKINVRGKFLICGEEKFYMKGVTYGTFKPGDDDLQFPVAEMVEKDFAAHLRNMPCY